MITKNHIQIYRKYDGDIDWWSRAGHKGIDLTEKKWFDIQNLLQNIFMMNAKLTSKEFDEKLMIELQEKTDGQETINAMLNYRNSPEKK